MALACITKLDDVEDIINTMPQGTVSQGTSSSQSKDNSSAPSTAVTLDSDGASHRGQANTKSRRHLIRYDVYSYAILLAADVINMTIFCTSFSIATAHIKEAIDDGSNMSNSDRVSFSIDVMLHSEIERAASELASVTQSLSMIGNVSGSPASSIALHK